MPSLPSKESHPDLRDITSLTNPPDSPDPTTKAEERKAAILGQKLELRSEFAPKLYRLTCVWLGAVLLVLVAQGVSEGSRFHFFRLHDEVLIALLGTTTVNIVGLAYAIAKYLFPARIPSSEVPRIPEGPTSK